MERYTVPGFEFERESGFAKKTLVNFKDDDHVENSNFKLNI